MQEIVLTKRVKDISNQKFGKLTVLQPSHKDKRGEWKWLCRCDCGNETIVYGSHLRKGDTISCGCHMRVSNLKHGYCKTSLYKRWLSMLDRCRNPKSDHYNNYGERGICVCDEWNDFVVFKEWAIHNGYSDDLTIDRIDVNGDYEPSNCRWVDMTIQANNKRSNHYLTIDGVTRTISEWSKINDIPIKTIYNRTKKLGMSYEKAVTKPVLGYGNTKTFLTYKGISKPIFEWAKEIGVSANTLYARKKANWCDADIIEKPIRIIKGVNDGTECRKLL